MTDPRTDRRERERLIAKAMAAALADCPAPEVLLAAQLDTRPRRIAAWRDPASRESVPVAQLLGLPPVVRRAVVALLAESLGCALVDLPGSDAGTDGTRLSLVAGSVKETGEANAELVARAADDSLSEAQVDRLVVEINEAVAALCAAKDNAVRRRRVSGGRR